MYCATCLNLLPLNKCGHCNKAFLDTDAVQPLPAPMRVRMGQKSGQLGLYPHEAFSESEIVVLHYPSCFIAYANIEENPYLYDQLYAEWHSEMEDQLNEEMKERYREKFDRVRKQVADGNFNFCVECFDLLEDPPPLMCLWCKKKDAVWTQTRDTGEVHFCARCHRYWNDQEEELAA
jgi:hypothetical protein